MNRSSILLLLLVPLLLTGCSTPQPTPAPKSAAGAQTIRWPAAYEPANAVFHVHNEIEIAAPPQVVWDILIRANAWPDWYVGARNVATKSPSGLLADKSSFAWETMGLRLETEVREFVPPFRLSWESRKSSLQGYHAWLIEPTPTGCRVVTDESFNGLLAFLQKVFIPRKLEGLHEVWLVELKKKAEAQARRR